MDKINPKDWDHWNRANYRREAIRQRIKESQLTQEQHNAKAIEKIREIRSRIPTTD